MEIRCCAFRGRAKGDWHTMPHQQRLEMGGVICNSITSVAKDSLIIEIYD